MRNNRIYMSLMLASLAMGGMFLSCTDPVDETKESFNNFVTVRLYICISTMKIVPSANGATTIISKSMQLRIL